MMRARIAGSLFVKIYLTLLAALAVLSLSSGLFVWLQQDEEDRGWAGRRDRFIAGMLPADAGAGEAQRLLDRLAGALGADIALYARDGTLIAAAGAPPPPEFPGAVRRVPRAGPHHFVARLPDGRVVAARLPAPFGPRRGRPLAWLALVAGVTGLVAYPVVRHLTRRLEELRLGVDDWGAGRLDRRVRVEGRDEVAAVAATFNRAAERVERLVESHRALLANASHELRSPLARLRMASDLHADSPREATRREIERNLAELDQLVEEILLASRLDHGADAMAREPVDMLAVAAEEGARSGVAVSGTAALVEGDPRLLTRLVRNLVQNAQKHGAPPVEVAVSAQDGVVVLSVRDHGAGIPAGEGERLFEPFYRPRGRGEAAGGWGLGLALVRRIAERHGGTVRHEVPRDGGARFVVTLPRRRKDGAGPA